MHDPDSCPDEENSVAELRLEFSDGVNDSTVTMMGAHIHNVPPPALVQSLLVFCHSIIIQTMEKSGNSPLSDDLPEGVRAYALAAVAKGILRGYLDTLDELTKTSRAISIPDDIADLFNN